MLLYGLFGKLREAQHKLVVVHSVEMRLNSTPLTNTTPASRCSIKPVICFLIVRFVAIIEFLPSYALKTLTGLIVEVSAMYFVGVSVSMYPAQLPVLQL